MNEELCFEIDFHPVGSGSKSGDAISLRYGKLNSSTNFFQKIIVIDGGIIESGQKLVQHIKNIYNSDTVDLVINTHPDNDHCSGLREVMNDLKVKELWLHTPWNFAKDFIDLFRDGRITDSSLKERLKVGLSIAHELEQLAKEKGIPVKEPFTGLSFDNGILQVLGPSETYYTELLAHFRSTPSPIAESTFSKAFSTVKEAISWVAETMDIETLDESGESSAENNSSVISLFSYSGKKILFTGDAGIIALKQVIEFAKYNSIVLNNIDVLQAPHHGSKRNISPSVINALKSQNAYFSCSPDGAPKHPSKKVTNAFKRRGTHTFSTKGNILLHRHNTSSRAGYSQAIEIPFYNEVEE